MKVPLGGGPATLLADATNSPSDIVVDTTSVYWIDFDSVLKASPK
jgi:hypothetical protein